MVALKKAPPDELRISSKHYKSMLKDVKERAPHEACGLVAGVDHKTMEVYPITNILSSSTRFRMDPEEQLRAFNAIDDHGWELLAIYHSHPYGPPHPSKTDLEEAAYPNTLYLIWSWDNSWICRGYIIMEKRIEEVAIFVEEDH